MFSPFLVQITAFVIEVSPGLVYLKEKRIEFWYIVAKEKWCNGENDVLEGIEPSPFKQEWETYSPVDSGLVSGV